MLLEVVFMGEKPLPCVRSKFREPALTPGNLLGSIHGVKQPLTPSIPMENNKMQGSTLKKSLTLLPVALGVMLVITSYSIHYTKLYDFFLQRIIVRFVDLERYAL